MSVNIKQLDGSLKKIAGSTILLDGTCSEIQSGTITASNIGTIRANEGKAITITLPVAFPDADYAIIFPDSTNSALNVTSQNVTATGFEVVFRNILGTDFTPSMDCTWYAFRLVELEGYNTIYNKMTNIDASPTENSTNLVTSGGVYDAIKNASSVFIGTSAEWESETSKTDYQVAILTDKPNVNAVDSTTGNIEVVANKHLVFKGTLEEWEALTTAEKKTYDEALITNDMDTGEVVNGVTDGDMRAVTSNAVYDAIAELFANDVEKTFFTPTPSSGSVVAADCWYIRKGNVVTVNIGIASMSASAPGEVIFTLPIGLRPCGQRVLHTGNNNNYAAESNIQILQNGDISIVCDGGCFGTVTYVTE